MRPTIAVGGSELEERSPRVPHRPHHAGPLVFTSPCIVAKPNTMKPSVRSQIVDVPVGSEGQLMMMGDPGTQATRTQSAPQIDVIPRLQPHCSKAPDLNADGRRTREDQRVCPWLWLKNHSRCLSIREYEARQANSPYRSIDED